MRLRVLHPPPKQPVPKPANERAADTAKAALLLNLEMVLPGISSIPEVKKLVGERVKETNRA